MKRVICICLSLILLLGIIPAQSFAANGGKPTAVNDQMTNPEFWNNKTAYKNHTLLMTADEIDKLNQTGIDGKGTYLYALDQFPDTYDAYAYKKTLANYEAPAKDVYINGQRIDKASYYNSVNKAIVSTGYSSSQQNYQYAIAVHLAALLNIPTPDILFYSLTDTDYENQISSLLIGEAFLIKQKCTFKGETFYYGFTNNCSGWVNAKDLALVDSKEDWVSYWKFSASEKNILVVTDDCFTLEQSIFAKDISGLSLKQGTILQLVPQDLIPSSVASRGTWYNHVVYIPTRGNDGKLVREIALIAQNNGISIGFMPMTQENIMKLAFASLGDTYGWGNMIGATDCSGYIRNIYRCFGLNIQRNTTWQQTTPGTVVDISYMSDDEKLQVIKQLPAGSGLYFPGHAMMYVGIDKTTPYVISNTAMLSDSEGELNVYNAYSVLLTPLTVRRASGTTWLHNITSAVVYPELCMDKLVIPTHYLLKDVKWGDYYYKAVEWALDKGITSGVDANHFAPNKTATIGTLLAFLSRALEIEITDEYDLNATLTRGDAIELVEKYSGKTLSYDESYPLDSTCTRAMAICFVYQAVK